MRGQLLEDARVSLRFFTAIHIHSDYFLKSLTFILVGIFCPLSRSVMGRAASVFVAWQRDAVVRHDAGLRTPTGITILESGWSTHAGNTGGRPKCRSGRQFARTGSVGSSDKPWGMQQAVKSIACGTQANTASVVGSAWKQVGPGPVCRPRSGVREPVCRLRKGIRALACKCGRRGRGYSPSRSAQPLGGKRKAKRRRLALWPT